MMSRLLRPYHTFLRLLNGAWAALAVLLFALPAPYVNAQNVVDAAMVTALLGNASVSSAAGSAPLKAFSRLKPGDSVLLDTGTQLKLLFLQNGRQEIWRGSGRIEVLEQQGKATGLPPPETTTLPRHMVAQIAKTPSESKIGRTEPRLRSLGVGGSVEKVEDAYRRMRMEAVRGDLNPELYLLSALFEMREIDRVEQVLSDLRLSRPNDQEAKLVIALYQKAVRNYREGGAKP